MTTLEKITFVNQGDWLFWTENEKKIHSPYNLTIWQTGVSLLDL